MTTNSMKQIIHWTTVGLFLLTTSICIGNASGATGEFTLDGNTLFLAHFNEKAHAADYANGWSQFAGMGAQLTEGYYGKAVDLRGLQFIKDFQNQAEPGNANARFDDFGFYPYANVNLDQGTYELWFDLAPPGELKASGIGTLLGSGIHRQVTKPGDKSSQCINISIRNNAIQFCLTFLPYDYEKKDVALKNPENFKNGLGYNEWHHFAMCWSKGELVIYIDGRPCYTTDMSSRKGLAFHPSPVNFIHLGGIVLDEWRISDVVRYEKEFEPAWRDGKRPEYAFPGAKDIKRYPAQLEQPYKPAVVKTENGEKTEKASLGNVNFLFDRQNGYLQGIGFGEAAASRGTGGLMLWQGLEHAWVPAKEAANWRIQPDQIAFNQRFANQVAATHAITQKDGVVSWAVTLENGGDKEAWLEPVMSVALPFEGVKEFFDGSCVQTKLPITRRRDTYFSTMPFAAASGDKQSMGVGLDPHFPYSALVNEWIPEGTSGTIRQGTKVALSPGERASYTFLLFAERADFGALSALERYHNLSPDLYRLRPDVPIYSYMPTAENILYLPIPDFWRITYVGGLWGHGPGHTAGDYFGTTRWWDNPRYYEDPSYAHALRLEKIWGSLANLRELITAFYRRIYENHYPTRRFHYCPDLTPDFIVKDLWPGYKPEGDPLAMDQYYSPIAGWLIVNEYQTPLGIHFKELSRRYWRQASPYMIGFINDMSHTTMVRHADPIAKKSPGRAFSNDKGTYVLGQCGRWDRYRTINSFVDNGHRASIWSDGGWMSYIACAYSAAIAIEGQSPYVFINTVSPAYSTARYMLGEKPLTVGGHIFAHDFMGKYFKPEDFTPASLRDYYRFCDANVYLLALKQGITFAPAFTLGRQAIIENIPIQIESVTSGRQTHPGGWVDEPLWMVRAGRGLKSLLVVANPTTKEIAAEVRLLNSCFGGNPLVGLYFGGETAQVLGSEKTTVEKVEVQRQGVTGLKCLGLLNGVSGGHARTSLAGDGISLQVKFDLDLEQVGGLTLNTFAPMYATVACKVNGKTIHLPPDDFLELPKGRSTVELTLKNGVFDFDAREWAAVDLLKDGKANFCLVANQGVNYVNETSEYTKMLTIQDTIPLGFERGTAKILNDFLVQYDWEDGQMGNLTQAPIMDKKPEGFNGWAVILKSDPLAGTGKVQIDSKAKEIIFTGRSQGEMRRAMVVFLRLVDRKYPHVGTLIPLQDKGKFYSEGKKNPMDIWLVPGDKEFREFLNKFADKDFLLKPLLRTEFDKLYTDGNRDFAGKYAMRFSPFIFEPTYTDTFIYGNEGDGTVETTAELKRGLSPEREAFDKKKQAEDKQKQAEEAQKQKEKTGKPEKKK